MGVKVSVVGGSKAPGNSHESLHCRQSQRHSRQRLVALSGLLWGQLQRVLQEVQVLNTAAAPVREPREPIIVGKARQSQMTGPCGTSVSVLGLRFLAVSLWHLGLTIMDIWGQYYKTMGCL